MYGCVEFKTLSDAQYDALCGIHSAHYCTHAYVYICPYCAVWARAPQQGSVGRNARSKQFNIVETAGKGHLWCLICFSQRCSYGKLKGELVLDKHDLHHGDKTTEALANGIQN